MVISELVALLGFKVDDSGREKYNKGIDETKQKQSSLTASLIKAQAIYGAVQRAIGAAFTFVRDSVINATAETERYRVTLGTMIGDQEKANKIIHDLDYGEGMFEGSRISDFYGTAAAIGGLQSMVTFGMQAEEAGDILSRLGDIAQGDSAAFQSLSLNMGQVFAKGKADGMDLKQFVTQGFDVVGEIGKITGKSRAEIEKAGVSYELTKKALENLTNAGGKYNGMLSKQMNTLGGVLKMFASFKAATAEAIGLGISDSLKELLKYILAIGKAGQDSFVNAFVSAIKEVIHWVYQIIIMFEVLGYRLEDMGDAFAPVKKFFLDLKDAAGEALTGIMTMAVEAGRLIVAAFEPIQAFASPIIKELGAIAKDVFTAIADFIRPLVPMVEGSAGFFGMLGQAIAGLLRPALKVALAIKGLNIALSGIKTVKNIGKTVGAFKDVVSAVKTASTGVGHGVSGIGEALSRLTGSPEIAAKLADTFGLLTGKVSVMRKAAEGNRLALMMLNVQMIKTKVASLAMAVAQKAQAIATGIASAATGVFNAVLAANPIILIVLGVMALIAAIVLLVKNWDKVKAAFGKAGEAIKTGIENIGGFFSGLGKKIAESKFGKKLSESFQGGFDKVKEKTRELLADFREKYPALYEAAASAFEKIKEKVIAVFSWIKEYFSAVWQSFKTSFGALLEVFKTIFSAIWNVIKTVGVGIWNVIKTVFDAIKNVVMSILGVFKTIFTGIWNVLKTIFSTIFNTILSIFDGLISIWKGGGNIFVKIWKSVKLIFTKVWQGIFTIVKTILANIIAIWKSIINVFSTILDGIKAVFLAAWNVIKDTVFAIVEGIKNVWRSFAAFLESLWEGIKAVASVIWDGIKAIFFAVTDSIKNAWQNAIDFIIGLWEDIKEVAAFIWDGIKGIFFGVIDGIKAVWTGFADFFSGLWDALTQGPGAAIEFIQNAFFGLFNSIQEKLFGFINKIREGWESVKGFFGGIGEGVVNFITGGDSAGGAQLQPAYAGSASRAAMAGAVGQTSSYAYNTMGGSSTVNAQTSINVNVPPGTPQEQREAIARQIRDQFDAKLADSINSGRANIPSPEVRRR